ncbi:MAG: cytochrome b N-terminal domain-containing protein [Draconibacterium sp.]|nr:cytochrome b N-terminal domain-containing protein [Draconibacterium sp.]
MKNNETKYPIFVNFLLHLHPYMLNKQAVKFSRTFGLGGINALLFVILTVTGILMRFFYVPTPEGAYDSIVSFQNQSILGTLIRNIHHWSAMFMVVAAFLHLLRVFYSQSIFYERRKNWYYGLALFIVVLAFNFTGYLLPWDQLSFWAVTIMTNIVEYLPFVGDSFANMIRGGETVNENTLLNFYTFHTALLPLLFVIFAMLHIWMVRKARGVTVANNNENEMVNVYPALIQKEIIVALSLVVFIVLFALFFDAPLLEKANPLISPNPSKAPWYFMGIQELLIHLHPFVATVVIPLALTIFFIYIPKINIDKDKVGTWLYSAKGKSIIILSTVFSSIITILLIVIFEYLLHLNQLNMLLFISTGIIPLFMFLVPSFAFLLYLKMAKKADKLELIISVTTIIFTSYIIMSLIGIWFRGEGMHLIF